MLACRKLLPFQTFSEQAHLQSESLERSIYERDMQWLRSADLVVAEVTQPSLGVGYELGAAEALGIPVVCLFRPASGRSLSAMLRGNAKFSIVEYETLSQAAKWLTDNLIVLSSEAVAGRQKRDLKGPAEQPTPILPQAD